MRHDFIGRRFGRLLVIERLPNYKLRHSYWKVRCDCGVTKHVTGMKLASGNTTSCGCRRREPKSHGLSYAPEYYAWDAARQRCHNPNSQSFKDYGARGIAMVDRWRSSFEAFIKDMGRRPTPKHELDRIDNDGPYAPDNCRWALRREQTRNTRRNTWLEFRGERRCLQDWAIHLGIKSHTLLKRLARWPLERALTTPKL